VAGFGLFDRVRLEEVDVELGHFPEPSIVGVEGGQPLSLRSSTFTRRLLAPCTAATSSFTLSWRARASLFWLRWIRNTIRKVTMVVPVLITSCHVSEY